MQLRIRILLPCHNANAQPANVASWTDEVSQFTNEVYEMNRRGVVCRQSRDDTCSRTSEADLHPTTRPLIALH